MPVTQEKEIFGPLDDPLADVKLPQGVISGELPFFSLDEIMT